MDDLGDVGNLDRPETGEDIDLADRAEAAVDTDVMDAEAVEDERPGFKSSTVHTITINPFTDSPFVLHTSFYWTTTGSAKSGGMPAFFRSKGH